MDCQAQEGADGRQAAAGSAAGSTVDTPGVTSALADVSEDYLINPGDVIDIQVDRAPELVRRDASPLPARSGWRISASIKAQGKTADELASFIANSLSDRYLKNRA